ncbi:MAG: lysostaphin resistance A-like protein [bacterium]
MDPLRLNRRDGLLITVCVVLFAASVFIGISWFDDAMPEASIDFNVTRSGAEQISLAWLDALGVATPAGAHHAAVFSYDNTAKVFLEKELGLTKAQGYFGDPIRLWSWRHRWFVPGKKEEVRVFVSPDGKVISANHLIEEDAEGANLSNDEAETIATTFLSGTLGINTDSVTFRDGTQEKRPNRTDWTFTWYKTGFSPVEGSEYRYEVTLLGDQIGGHREYLHVPEAWQASYSKLRSYNQLAGSVDGLFMVLTFLAIIVVFVQKLRSKDIRWKTSLIFGVITAALVYTNNLNSLPNSLYYYDTTTSWSGFLIQEILVGLLQAAGVGVMISLLTAGAESIYREIHPQAPSLPWMFTLRGLRTKRAFISIVLGVTMTAFFFAYQVIFYLIAQKFGGWSPADVPYDNLLNTAMPWLAVLMIGFLPAVSEEFMSRMFSIPFLQKLFKGRYTWLAVVIPAFIWGFGHATYPNQPFWIRGVEVGVAGVIVGVIFLRFGILAALIWHYTVDAFYTAFLLLGSGNLYFVLTAAVGAGLVAIPLLLTLAAYLRTGTFLPETGLTNAELTPAASPESQTGPGSVTEAKAETVALHLDTSPQRPPLSTLVRLLPIAVIALAFLIQPEEKPGNFLKFNISGAVAEQTFSDSLRATGWADPDTMIIRATLGSGNPGPASEEAWALKHLPTLAAFNERFDTLMGVGRWTVRAWTRGNRLRFTGLVHGRTGKIVSMSALLPEEMPSDSLSADSARTLIESALAGAGVDVSRLTLANRSQQERPSRLDYSFEYEAAPDDPRVLGEARLRWSGSVQGSYVSIMNTPHDKVPESWERDRTANTGLRTAKRVAVFLLQALLVGYAIILLLLRTRKGMVDWKRVALYALVPTFLHLLTLPGMFHRLELTYFFSTQVPWNVFIGNGIVEMVIVAIFIYGLYVLLFAIADAFYKGSLGGIAHPARDSSPIDLVAAAVAALGVFGVIVGINGWLTVHFPSSAVFDGWGVPDVFGGPMPALVLAGSGFAQAVAFTGLAMIAAHLWSGPFKTPLLRVLLLVLLTFLLQDLSAVGSGETVLSLVLSALVVLSGWGVLRFWIRGSSARLALAAWLIASLPDAVQGISVFPVFAGAAWFGIVIILAIPAIWIALDMRRARA